MKACVALSSQPKICERAGLVEQIRVEQQTNHDQFEVTISVVSHLQADLIAELLAGLRRHCTDVRFELILTLNLDEALPFEPDAFGFPITLLRNAVPQGFAANQNRAFTQASGKYFCVVNPDIRLSSNPLTPLLDCVKQDSVGVVAPLVLDEAGALEDSARRFPTPLIILSKLFGRAWTPDYQVAQALVYPDWVAGMFMLFPSELFARVGGFDSRYFLYYEDVDICARLRLLSYEVVLCPLAVVTHCAQRHSHRSFRFLRWHLSSMRRFFLSPGYRRLGQGAAPTPMPAGSAQAQGLAIGPSYDYAKRLFDLALASAATLALLLPLILVALSVRLTSRGPILYWSDRIGQNNRRFKMPKFRSMQPETPVVATHLLECPDAYLTPVGSFLRRSSLDELPQLWCILKGEMSLVGPRPALFNQHDLIELRTQAGIHTLLPGLTGWAQINGRDELPLAQKLALDAEYLRRKSFRFDLKIIVLTAFKVIKRDNVLH